MGCPSLREHSLEYTDLQAWGGLSHSLTRLYLRLNLPLHTLLRSLTLPSLLSSYSFSSSISSLSLLCISLPLPPLHVQDIFIRSSYILFLLTHFAFVFTLYLSSSSSSSSPRYLYSLNIARFCLCFRSQPGSKSFARDMEPATVHSSNHISSALSPPSSPS